MSDEEDFDSDRSDSYDEDKVPESDAGKRAYHNLLERKRRDNLKVSFCQLRDILPFFKNKKKSSRVQILKKSREFIDQRPKLDIVIKETEDIVKETEYIDKSADELEEAIKKNDYATINRIKAAMAALPTREFLFADEDSNSHDCDNSEDDSSSSEPAPAYTPPRKRRRTRC